MGNKIKKISKTTSIIFLSVFGLIFSYAVGLFTGSKNVDSDHTLTSGGGELFPSADRVFADTSSGGNNSDGNSDGNNDDNTEPDPSGSNGTGSTDGTT